VWEKTCARFLKGMVATRAQPISNALKICLLEIPPHSLKGIIDA
jgi:hypothetical protein